MDLGFDPIDRRIVYRLTEDARHTSAPDIAEEVDVSPPTIRNRIRDLEDEGVLKGYHAHVDYEAIGGLLTNLFMCTATTTNRKRFAQRVLEVSGVVNVREVMTGTEDLQVTVVGKDTHDVRRIAREISTLGVRVGDEDLLHREHFRPYAPFGPEESAPEEPVTGVADISEDADVVELKVDDGAPVVGKTLDRAKAEGLLDGDLLVIAVEQDGEGTTPTGETVVEAGDVVTLFSRTGVTPETLRPFSDGED